MFVNNIDKICLANGVRIITEKINGVRSVSVGIWVGAGSGHENDENLGITHFIEHLMFKGTQKRSSIDIAESLDSVGGQLNAFTTKECTCYYAKVVDEHFDLALDVLADIFFNSTFSEKSIEKERGVIEEEIKMYEDTPDELIHDLFVQTLWDKHPLGKPILGTFESLHQIDRRAITKYIDNHYLPTDVVVAVAGNIEHKDVQEKVRKYFEGMEVKGSNNIIAPPGNVTARQFNLPRETGQVQICLGTKGLSQQDERLYSAIILNNVLGGGLSSRLVQSVREERGLAYSVYSYHTTFCDTGLFIFYAGTSPTKYEEVIHLLADEIKLIIDKGITPRELEKSKEQIKGGIFLGLESVSSRMSRLGRTELCLNRIVTPDEVINKVFEVNLEGVHDIAQILFKEQEFCLSTIGLNEQTIDIKELFAS